MHTAPAGHPLSTLTARELQVLRLVALGRSNAGIAQELWISKRTVENHIANVFDKLEFEDTGERHRRVQAAVSYTLWTRRPPRPSQMNLAA